MPISLSRFFCIFVLFCCACGSPGVTKNDDGSGDALASLALKVPGGVKQQPQPACVLVVPDNPLSAKGLATPYELLAPCQESNADLNAFVQAVILDPATGALSVYNPLVVDRNTRPLVAPTLPTLPDNAVVGLWFGFNGTTLILESQNANTLHNANCINGIGDSFFGQVASCNAVPFFAAVNNSNLIVAPPLGTGKDGLPCPTTRDFSVVDNDPSDNVTTSYLAAADGRIAQNTPENVKALAAAKVAVTVINNGSDNALLAAHIDVALGCTPWEAPDITSPGADPNNRATFTAAQALNEMSAQAFHSAKDVPQDEIALVEIADEMVLLNGQQSVTKMNLYRSMVDQPVNVLDGTQQWCEHLATIGAPRINTDKKFTINQPTVDDTVGTNLFTFLVGRLQGTMGNTGNGLNCASFGVQFPFNVVMNGQGVVTSATLKP